MLCCGRVSLWVDDPVNAKTYKRGQRETAPAFEAAFLLEWDIQVRGGVSCISWCLILQEFLHVRNFPGHLGVLEEEPGPLLLKVLVLHLLLFSFPRRSIGLDGLQGEKWCTRFHLCIKLNVSWGVQSMV